MSILLKTINASDTTLMMSTDISFPNSDGVIKIGSEIIIYDELYMGTLYGCVRGARSTAAASHTTGATISLIDFYAAAPVPTPGEVNTASNVGSGEGLFAQKVLEDLQFKSLTAGNGITLTPSTDDITLSVTDPLSLSTGLNLADGGVIKFNTAGDAQFYLDSGLGVFVLDYDGDASIQSIGPNFGLFVPSGNYIGLGAGYNGFTIQLRNETIGGVIIEVPDVTTFLTINNAALSTILTMSEVVSPTGSIVMNSYADLRFDIGIASPVTAVSFDASTTAGDTRMLLWDVDSGALVRVSVGADDSAGIGFKVLCIPN